MFMWDIKWGYLQWRNLYLQYTWSLSPVPWAQWYDGKYFSNGQWCQALISQVFSFPLWLISDYVKSLNFKLEEMSEYSYSSPSVPGSQLTVCACLWRLQLSWQGSASPNERRLSVFPYCIRFYFYFVYVLNIICYLAIYSEERLCLPIAVCRLFLFWSTRLCQSTKSTVLPEIEVIVH